MLTVAMILIIGLATMPAQAKITTVTTNENVNMSMLVYIPCTEEFVYLEGTIHYLYHVTINDDGMIHVKTHTNPQGVNGVGTNGTTFHGVGVTQHMTSFDLGRAYTYTYVNNFNIISKGSGGNFMIHEDIHTTVNPNGTVTSHHSNYRVSCK